MIVVDTSVFLHKLDQSIEFEHDAPEFQSAIKANLAWLMSGQWLGEELKPLMGNMVFVQDTKPYWRAEYLKDLRNVVDIPKPTRARSESGKARALKESQEKAAIVKAAMAEKEPTDADLEILETARREYGIDYKAGRKFPEYRFKKIRKLVSSFLKELGAATLEAYSYEADDLAASLVKTNSRAGNPWNILLLTVDSDWLGMLNENVTWVCMTGYAPTVRDTIDSINGWALKRLGATLGTWRDIWDIKSHQGDDSDNLPPSAGHLLPVIDLLNPPLEHMYWLREPEKLVSLFRLHSARFSDKDAQDAEYFLKLAGTKPVVKYLPDVLDNLSLIS